MSSSEDSSDDGSSSSDDSSSENEGEQSPEVIVSKQEVPPPKRSSSGQRRRKKSDDGHSRRRRSPSPHRRHDRRDGRDSDRRVRDRDRDYKRRRSYVDDDTDDELQGQPASPPPPRILQEMRRRKRDRRRVVEGRKKKKSERVRVQEKFIAALPGLTQMARRIYVGNLAATQNNTESSLKSFFTEICPMVGITRKNPVVSVWVSPEKTFCFVEFKCVRDSDTAIQNMQSFRTPNGRELRVGRPKHYKEVPEFMKDFILGEKIPKIPRDFDIEGVYRVRQLEQAAKPVDSSRPFQYFHDFGDRNNHNNSNNEETEADRRYLDKRIRQLPLPGKGSFQAQTSNPDATRVIVLENRLFVTELASENSHRSLVSEIKQECKKFGSVLKVKVPNKGRSEGCVFVKYKSIDFAVKAKEGINDKLFSGRQIKVAFFDEDRFDADDFHGASRYSK